MTAAKVRPAVGSGAPTSKANATSSTPRTPRSATPETSRSIATTEWPRSRNQRVWRPPPHATSRTSPPGATEAPKRVTHADGITLRGSLGRDRLLHRSRNGRVPTPPVVHRHRGQDHHADLRGDAEARDAVDGGGR